jgi:hypothetical protein
MPSASGSAAFRLSSAASLKRARAVCFALLERERGRHLEHPRARSSGHPTILGEKPLGTAASLLDSAVHPVRAQPCNAPGGGVGIRCLVDRGREGRTVPHNLARACLIDRQDRIRNELREPIERRHKTMLIRPLAGVTARKRRVSGSRSRD